MVYRVIPLEGFLNLEMIDLPTNSIGAIIMHSSALIRSMITHVIIIVIAIGFGNIFLIFLHLSRA